MELKKYFKSSWNKNCFQEFQSSIYRYQDSEFSKGGSVKGRLFCLIGIPTHGVMVLGKPFLYTAAVLGKFAAGVFFGAGAGLNVLGVIEASQSGKKCKAHFIQSGRYAFCIPAAFIGQIVQTGKSIGGVFHPAAYFRTPPSPNISTNSTDSSTDLPNSSTDSVSPEMDAEDSGETTISLNKIICSVSYAKKSPMEALESLDQAITNVYEGGGQAGLRSVKVQHHNEAADDRGGLLRAYVYDIFEGLRDRFTAIIDIADDKNRKDFKKIGRILNEINSYNNSNSDLKIYAPNYLSKQFIKAVFSFNPLELKGEFQNIPLGRILTLAGIASNPEDPEEKKEAEKWQFLNDLFKASEEGNYKDFARNNYDELHLHIGQVLEYELIKDPDVAWNDFVVANQEEVLKVIEDYVKDYCAPKVCRAFWIAQGVCEHNLFWNMINSERFYQNVIAVFDKQTFIDNMKFENLSEEQENCIRDWCNKQNEEALKILSRVVTGGLSSDPITFYGLGYGNDDNTVIKMTVSTCSEWVLIPDTFSVKEIRDCLETWVDPVMSQYMLKNWGKS